MDESGDPYRLDTQARHTLARWFVAQLDRFVPGGAEVHLRGLHYAIASASDVAKPTGAIYANTAGDYDWLCSDCARPARWLGYVPFDRLRDEKNEAPAIFTPEHHHAAADDVRIWGAVAPLVSCFAPTMPDLLADPLPSAHALRPYLALAADGDRQRWRVSLWAEKSSARSLLLPIAQEVRGELVLPGGDPSDTMLFQAMRRAAADGRGLAVVYLADCDPAGLNMPRAVARKLGALRHAFAEFAHVPVVVVRAGVTPQQAEAWGLPSTPLKPGEARAAAWVARWGREQSELDAALVLAPDELAAAVRAQVARFHDSTLAEREWRARRAWDQAAVRWRDSLSAMAPHVAAIEAARGEAEAARIDLAERVATVLADAEAVEAKRETLCAAMVEAAPGIDAAVVEATKAGELPMPETPEPVLTEGDGPPLFDSAEGLVAATARLILDRDGAAS